MLLMIDNYDSFTYNLVRLFNELGHEINVLKNDGLNIEEFSISGYEGLVLSPGPGKAEATANLIPLIEKFKNSLPILGICLGHQAVASAFGGKVIKGIRPMHGRVTPVQHDGTGIFAGIKSPLQVTEYHSLTVEKESLPQELVVTCWDQNGAIMGIRHRELPIEGVQFHPEAELTECGHDLLKNFVQLCKERGPA